MTWGHAVGAALVFALAGVAAVVAVSGDDAAADEKVTRTYYVAADEVAWDYASSGIDQIAGEPFGEMGGKKARTPCVMEG